MFLMHILLKSIDADIKSEIGSSRGGLRPYLLRFYAKAAGADAKLIQHGPIGVAYHHGHPISTVPIARITAQAMVPGLITCTIEFCSRSKEKKLQFLAKKYDFSK
jgi:hypothetical protein